MNMVVNDVMKKVLVAEDYADTRSLMKFFLESFGYEVIEAVDGEQAVNKVNESNPDLVLMDVSMPVMDGLTATRIIRNSQRKSTVPIIAVTAYGDFYHQNAIDAGCDDLINKPLDFDALEPYIRKYLDQ